MTMIGTDHVMDGETLVLRGMAIPPRWQAILPAAKGFSLVNAYGQGMGIDRDPEILPYLGRRYFYVVDPADGAAFSPTLAPMLTGVDDYTVRMHPASVAFTAAATCGVTADTRVCVDPATGGEVWAFTLRHAGDAPRRLSLVALIPFQPKRGFGARGWLDEATGAVVKHSTSFFTTNAQYEALANEKAYAFVVADRMPDDYSASLRAVLPLDEQAGAPPFLADLRLGKTPAFAEEVCGALRLDVTLPARGEATVRLAIGAARTMEEIAVVRARLADDTPFQATLAEWQTWDAGVRVEVPHPEMQAFLNTHLKHQTRMNCVTARWSQAPATRNWLQDWQGAAYLQPAGALEALRRALAAQRADGFLPQGFTLNSYGKLVDALGMDFRDAPTWAPPMALTLLEVLGDPAFLAEELPYIDGGSATVLDHLHQGMQFLADRRGQHGMVLFGEGDWNDQLNNVGTRGIGESTWLSFAFIHACRSLAEVDRWAGHPERAAALLRWADEVEGAVNTHAWDGAWYVRGFTDDGVPFGTATADEGRIFLEPQVWCFIAGAVPPERAAQVLASIEREMLTPCGPRLLAPPFRRWHPELGRISVDLPGNKENGSAYCHATMFYVKALLAAGRVDEAVAQLAAVLPGNPANAGNGQHPAYIPNGYVGPEAGPAFAGRGSNHNWTGTAPWYLQLCLREILGIHGTPAGVRFAPQFPSTWPGARLTLPFRGAILDVTYQRGAVGVSVDGRALPDGTLAPLTPGHTYQVVIGV